VEFVKFVEDNCVYVYPVTAFIYDMCNRIYNMLKEWDKQQYDNLFYSPILR